MYHTRRKKTRHYAFGALCIGRRNDGLARDIMRKSRSLTSLHQHPHLIHHWAVQLSQQKNVDLLTMPPISTRID